MRLRRRSRLLAHLHIRLRCFPRELQGALYLGERAAHITAKRIGLALYVVCTVADVRGPCLDDLPSFSVSFPSRLRIILRGFGAFFANYAAASAVFPDAPGSSSNAPL